MVEFCVTIIKTLFELDNEIIILLSFIPVYQLKMYP